MDGNTKQRNLESALLFMQQEHADTLKGLHAEIAKLQKRCSELTWKSALEGAYISSEDEYREKAEHLEKELADEKTLNDQLNKAIDIDRQEIFTLEQKCLLLEKRYCMEVEKSKEQRLLAEKALEAKADEIAHLRLKLRAAKVKERDCQSNEEAQRLSLCSSGSMRSSKSSDSGSSGLDQSYSRSPLPPSAAPPSIRRRHNPAVISQPQSFISRRLSSENAEIRPDVTPFLRRESEDKQVAKKEKRVPLPPIASKQRGGKFVNEQEHIKIVSQHNAVTMPHLETELEVETLAIDHVTKPQLHRAQEFGNSKS